MRRVLMVCVMAGVASAAGAQGLSYGVKAGVNLSTFQAESQGEGTSFDVLTGLVAGGFLTWPLSERLDVQPEVLFSQKGASFDSDGVTLKQTIDYLEIPILVDYRLFGAPERHLSAFGGPSVALRLRARARSTYGDDTLERDVSDEVKSTDVGVVGGVAYHIGRLVIDGRYSWGLTDIDDETEDTIHVKNRSFSVLAGWRF